MEWLEPLVRFAQEQLGDREREALWTRGVTDEQIELFRLGAINKKLPDLSYPKDFLEWCWQGRRLDDMFLLPLTNTLGQVKGLQFRHVDRDRRGYSDYIPFEDEPVLFGLAQAMPHVWQTESVWLVEGAFDLFPIQRVYPEIVATLTARLSGEFSKLLRRLVKEIWLGYDMDKAGRDARARILRTYGREFTVRDVAFPQPLRLNGEKTKDPSELWEAWGDSQFGVFLKRLKDPYHQEIK
jgi:DNA primase